MQNNYVTRYSLRDICSILEIDVPSEYESFADKPLTNMAYSLTFLQQGGALFIRGVSYEDRAHMLDKAIEAGAAVVFCMPDLSNHPQIDCIPHIFLDRPFKAVQSISAHIRNDIGMKVVGVTGSIGKTSTKDFIFSVLNVSHEASRSLGNQNTIYPIFNNMQKLSPDTEFYVQEFGIKNKNVMPNTVNACVPDAAVITNIQEPHLEVFGTKEGILVEKLRMARKMKPGCPVFLNYDDPLLREVELEEYPIISFAVGDRDADYFADNIVDKGREIEFDIVHEGRRIHAKLNVPGAHNIGNALVACAVGQWFGVSDKDIVTGIGRFKGKGIRQNIVDVGGYTLFLDCYNTAPASVLSALAVLDKMELEPGGRRIAVLSDIPRMGDDEIALHEETGRRIGSTSLDVALCFGDEKAKVLSDAIEAQGIESRYTADRAQLNAWISEVVTRKDVVLFKGSVPRLLSKSVDQVFGTSYHANSEHFEHEKMGDFRIKVIWESAAPDEKTVAVSGYTGQCGCVHIPAQYEGIDAFAIAARAFEGNADVCEVSIPEPIYSLGASCFRGCSNLKRVSLPHTLKVIGANAFRDCAALEEVIIPEGVIEIGDNAFRDCKKLKRIVVPSSVGRIGIRAFWGCAKAKIKAPATEYLSVRLGSRRNVTFR